MDKGPFDDDGGIVTLLVDLLVHTLPLFIGEVFPVIAGAELEMVAIAFFASKLALAAVVVVTDWSLVRSVVVEMFISSVQVRANRSPTKNSTQKC